MRTFIAILVEEDTVFEILDELILKFGDSKKILRGDYISCTEIKDIKALSVEITTYGDKDHLQLMPLTINDLNNNRLNVVISDFDNIDFVVKYYVETNKLGLL